MPGRPDMIDRVRIAHSFFFKVRVAMEGGEMSAVLMPDGTMVQTAPARHVYSATMGKDWRKRERLA